jgi:hypothetical protein
MRGEYVISSRYEPGSHCEFYSEVDCATASVMILQLCLFSLNEKVILWTKVERCTRLCISFKFMKERNQTSLIFLHIYHIRRCVK